MESDIHIKVDILLGKRWRELKAYRGQRSQLLRRAVRLIVKAVEEDEVELLSVMLKEIEKRLGKGGEVR